MQVRDGVHYSLYAFVAGVVRIYEQLSTAGQTRLKGMLFHELRPDENLLSLQHEILTAVHLVARGFDVELNDIENGAGGVDFIARRDGAERRWAAYSANPDVFPVTQIGRASCRERVYVLV